MAHTPGPIVRWQAFDADGYVITESIGKFAVARTAAPELLDALQVAVTLLRMHVEPELLRGERFDLTDCKDMKPIFAAIAKATRT